MKTYAAYYDDNEIRIESSSGGLFSLIAYQFDIVYGVAMNENCQDCEFVRIEGKDIEPLRGSKYIQAKVGKTFRQVKEDLLEGKQVLFTGTSCQVNGLHTFLQKNYSNLFCVDIICHGVATHKYWKKFIEGKKIERINFRAKDGGWNNYSYGMKLNNIYIPYYKNKFMALYVKDYVIRPSCYECVCKQIKKSDITLGDFWGIETLDPSMTDNKGTSVVFVRTDKGEVLFDSLKEKMVWKEVSYENGVKQNPSEYQSSSRPIDREKFFEDMEKMNFDELYKKYYPKLPLRQKIIGKFKQLIRKLIK